MARTYEDSAYLKGNDVEGQRGTDTHTVSEREIATDLQAGRDRHAEKETHLKTYRKNVNRFRQGEIDRQKQRQTDTDTHRNVRKQRDT